MALQRGRNAVRHNILSLYYLGVTLHSQKRIFNCDRKKIWCHHLAFLSQISARSKRVSYSELCCLGYESSITSGSVCLKSNWGVVFC